MSTILLVQPDLELNEIWAEALARTGHDVLRVQNIEDATARAREGGIDVVVVDSDGTDDPVRALVGELERLPDAPPMVLVSDSPLAPELSAQVGAAGFLPKPCSSADLVEIVARVASAAVRHPAFADETTSPRKRY